jgi:molybdopterin molybdotransferase
MITVNEATAIVLSHPLKPSVQRLRLAECTGKVLAEPVVADRDFPAFDRVSMDGIAIVHDEWRGGRRTYAIAGIQAAGEEQKTLAEPTGCLEVMTGAILPAGCDTVVRYEDIEIDELRATIKTDSLTAGHNIHRQATDARKGQTLLEPGQVIAPSEIALLASVGMGKVSVFTFPRVAIISTGDELVEIDSVPTACQMRRSNSYALAAALREIGGDAVCFHLEDEKLTMELRLQKIVEDYDVLILSGGVSKGKFDFVPTVLENIGVHKLFHQVSQRPGKPFWFGRSDGGKTAFALPGNPVSTFMCFFRYVKPWFLKSLGAPAPVCFAVLSEDFSFPNPLTYFLQVWVRNEGGRLMAYPVPGGGSGDFANLKNVTGFLELPLEGSDFRAGEVFPYIAFRH